MNEDELIKKTLTLAKTIAMVGVSSIKKEISTSIKRRPSTIVMKYMQEFGYKVIPVNPFSVGEKIHGETIVAKLSDIKIPIDIVDIFRPSKEAPIFAQETVKVGAKFFWLQYGFSLFGIGIGYGGSSFRIQDAQGRRSRNSTREAIGQARGNHAQ